MTAARKLDPDLMSIMSSLDDIVDVSKSILSRIRLEGGASKRTLAEEQEVPADVVGASLTIMRRVGLVQYRHSLWVAPTVPRKVLPSKAEARFRTSREAREVEARKRARLREERAEAKREAARERAALRQTAAEAKARAAAQAKAAAARNKAAAEQRVVDLLRDAGKPVATKAMVEALSLPNQRLGTILAGLEGSEIHSPRHGHWAIGPQPAKPVAAPPPPPKKRLAMRMEVGPGERRDCIHLEACTDEAARKTASYAHCPADCPSFVAMPPRRVSGDDLRSGIPSGGVV